MAKLTFEEWRLRREYQAYLDEQETADESELNNLPGPSEDPKPVEDPKPEVKPAVPAAENDVQKQLDEIKAAMGVMAKALQPSLGDIQPVGIDDVVKKFFDVK